MATAAKRATGQPRAGLAVPGWTRVAPAVPGGGAPPGARTSIRRGSAGMPDSVSSRHQRATSCSPGHQRGEPAVLSTAGWAKAISRLGRVASSSWWLCGPRPCRFTATSAASARRSNGAKPGPSLGISSSARSRWDASGWSHAGVASTRRCSGKASASARSAGTTVSRSPSPGARRARTVALFTARMAPWRGRRPARAARSLPAGGVRTRGGGHVLGVVEAGVRRRLVLLGPVVEEAGAHPAGDQQGHADASGGLRGQRPGEAHHPELARAVGAGVGQGPQPERGGHRDDPAAGGLHEGQGGANHRGGAEQVDGHHPLPVVGRYVGECAAAVDPRRGHHRVEATVPLGHRAHRRLGGTPVGQVDGDELDGIVGLGHVEHQRLAARLGDGTSRRPPRAMPARCEACSPRPSSTSTLESG
jgi:hypothetical protein